MQLQQSSFSSSSSSPTLSSGSTGSGTGLSSVSMNSTGQDAPSIISFGNANAASSTEGLSKEEIRKREMQFGPLIHPSHRHIAQHPKGEPLQSSIEQEPPLFYLLTTYISYLILIIFGHVRDFFGRRFRPEKYVNLVEKNVSLDLRDGRERY